MTTGGTPPGDGSHTNPYGGNPEQPSWGQDPYPGQGYGQQGQEPYPDQGFGQSDYGQQYGATGYPQPGAAGGVVAAGKIAATDAIGAAWQLFKNNPLPWVLITLITGVANGIMNIITNSDSAGMAFIGTIVTIAISLVLQAFMIRGALLEVDGHKPAIGDFFKLSNFGPFVIAAIIVGIATAIGTILFIIPGLVIAFFLYWTFHFVIDRNMTAVDAIKSSFNAIKSDGGNLFLLAFLNVLIIIVGTIALLVGLLVAVPIVTLASTVAYRAITGPSDFSRNAAATA